MTTATGNAVLRAYARGVRDIEADAKKQASPTTLAAERSAGFIIPDGQKRGKRRGYQVFVKVCAYSEELLKENPMTGGLLYLNEQCKASVARRKKRATSKQ